ASVLLMPVWDYGSRLKTLTDAIVDHPNSAELNTQLGQELITTGRLKEGIFSLQRAASLDPFSRDAAWGLLAGLVLAGRNDDARLDAEEASRTWGDFYAISQKKFEAALWSSDYAGARRLLADPVIARQLQPDADVRPHLAIIKALESRKPQDVRLVAERCA